MNNNLIKLIALTFAFTLQPVANGPLCAQLSRPAEGFTEPIKTVLVASAESGVLQKLSVREGDVVQAGEIIGQLDCQILQATLSAGREKLAAVGKINAARATLDSKTHHLKQMQKLLSGKHASAKEVRQAKLEYDLAKANLETANDEHRLQEMEVKKIEAQIERRTIRAPADGVILELPRQEGEAVSLSDSHVATVVSLSRLRVRYFLTTDHATSLERGDQLTVSFPDTQQHASAKVDFVAPVTDSNSGTVRVELVIENQSSQCRSGLRCVLPNVKLAGHQTHLNGENHVK